MVLARFHNHLNYSFSFIKKSYWLQFQVKDHYHISYFTWADIAKFYFKSTSVKENDSNRCLKFNNLTKLHSQ